MEQRQLLKNDSRFGDYEVSDLMSHRHEREREVYRAEYCKTGEPVALTVFNLDCKRYESDTQGQSCQADFIEEIRFYKQCVSADGNSYVSGLPKYLGCGIDTNNRHRYGWVAQEYIDGESLDKKISCQGRIPFRDAFEIFKRVSSIVNVAARFTHGGGHYNISTDNIIVKYEGDELVDVKLIGFTNIGTSYNGKSTIDVDDLDKRFRAPETLKGIHNHRSDIYSLGMVLLLMLTGYPRTIETEEYSFDFGSEGVDITKVSSMDFYKALWKKADKNLSNSLRLILRKATNISPESRFATVDKFNEFLAKVMHNHINAQIISEESRKVKEQVDLRHSGGERQAIEKYSIADLSLPRENEIHERKALDEVAGMADLKALFRRDFIRIIRNPKVAQAYGIKPSNCTLLYGPQGCGKTFIAEKAAQESGLKYKIVNPSELGSIYIHGSQQKIAEIFAEAEKKGPMILIFDEFDALVPKRDNDLNGNQANEVNEMLSQLNNCAERGVYVLATTNRPGLIDPAIMRKGRVDRSVYVSLPDKEARAELFRIEIEKRPHLDMDYDVLASVTENYTCSDLSFIVAESASLCFEETLDRNLAEPLPLSMNRLLEVVKATIPSVSEEQRKEYLELKTKMENRQAEKERKKVGFAI